MVSGSRLSDMLNSGNRAFLALTDAVVRDAASGAELSRPGFLAINRASVEVIYPV
jgi:hypothetical protein